MYKNVYFCRFSLTIKMCVLSKEYINSTYPKTTIIRKKAKKLAFFSLYIGNDEASNMNFNSMCVVYTVGSYYKGD